MKRWIELHGIRLRKRGAAVFAEIAMACKALTSDGYIFTMLTAVYISGAIHPEH